MIQVHIAELVALSFIILSGVDGWRKGLLLKLYGFIRFLFMIVIIIVITPFIYQIVPAGSGLREGISVLAAIVIAGIIVGAIARVFGIVDRLPVIHTLNHIGGAALGLIIGVMAVWVLLLFLAAFEGVEWCDNITKYVAESPVLTTMQKTNPITYIFKEALIKAFP